VAYHAAYGLVSLARDYLKNALLRACAIFLVILVAVLAAYLGLKLTLII
ncbi:MAG: hypothetical protein JRJ59_12980, partial [Deltaproteobacteria bacterium]|nr:hypothetical protein [Deltaproteobacteria bacterium]